MPTANLPFIYCTDDRVYSIVRSSFSVCQYKLAMERSNVSAYVYSGTSNSGPSEIGTQYNRPSLQRTQVKAPKICFPIHFEALYKGHNS